MSDTKDKNSKGIIIGFKNGSEVGESLESDQDEPPKQEVGESLESDQDEPPKQEVGKSLESDQDKSTKREVGESIHSNSDKMPRKKFKKVKKNLWNFFNAGLTVAVLGAVFVGWLELHDFKITTEDVLSKVATQDDINLLQIQIGNNSDEVKDVIDDYKDLDDTIDELAISVGIVENEVI